MLKRILIRAAAIGIGCGLGKWLSLLITNPLTAVPTWMLVSISAVGGFLGGLVVFGIMELLTAQRNKRK